MVASDERPARALAVYAHPDDPEISAGGTLATWAAAGTEVWVLITTRGDKGSQDPAADLDALAALRVEETAKAVALLGFAGARHLGYHDGELPDDQELRGAITRVIREVATERSLKVAEVSRHFIPPWTGKFSVDNFHPSQDGYRDWSRALVEALIPGQAAVAAA